MSISARLHVVRERIAAAAERAARAAGEVTLVAVSKTQPARAVRAAYEAGQRDFGENYAQELLAKAEALRDLPELRWHFVGHVQRNKVAKILPVSWLLHAVDSPRLLQEIERRAAHARVLFEVNLAGEANKSGCAPAELGALVQSAKACTHVRAGGLMAVPPAGEPEAARPWFRRLRALANEHGLSELSMGMTGDFEVAIEEGATLVRIGTAIFGAR